MSRAVYYDMSGNEVYDDVPTRAQEELEYIENNKTKHEAINHPDYYKGNGIEAIDVIEAWNLDFCLGNTVKYIARCGKKSNKVIEDLKKAAWYLNREIERMKHE